MYDSNQNDRIVKIRARIKLMEYKHVVMIPAGVFLVILNNPFYENKKLLEDHLTDVIKNPNKINFNGENDPYDLHEMFEQ